MFLLCWWQTDNLRLLLKIDVTNFGVCSSVTSECVEYFLMRQGCNEQGQWHTKLRKTGHFAMLLQKSRIFLSDSFITTMILKTVLAPVMKLYRYLTYRINIPFNFNVQNVKRILPFFSPIENSHKISLFLTVSNQNMTAGKKMLLILWQNFHFL